MTKSDNIVSNIYLIFTQNTGRNVSLFHHWFPNAGWEPKRWSPMILVGKKKVRNVEMFLEGTLYVL